VLALRNVNHATFLSIQTPFSPGYPPQPRPPEWHAKSFPIFVIEMSECNKARRSKIPARHLYGQGWL